MACTVGKQQDVLQRLSDHLAAEFNCFPVFMEPYLKQRFYQGFCKQQLWPLLHYVLPMSPYSLGRFNPELWQAYVRANMIFTERLVETVRQDIDYVWIHDYHLMVLPSLLRRRLHKVAIGFFLHSGFPSSEIFRAFPKREEVLRSLLNADVLGFHTFDYARHFISCCSRMLGLEHYTKRGSILMNYYGRDVHLKILPSCARLLPASFFRASMPLCGSLDLELQSCCCAGDTVCDLACLITGRA
jgi:trehalose 6-phosphate synthase/phosphatase